MKTRFHGQGHPEMEDLIVEFDNITPELEALCKQYPMQSWALLQAITYSDIERGLESRRKFNAISD